MRESKEHRVSINEIRAEHYDRDRLKAMFLIKGKGAYLRPAAEMLCLEEKTTSLKINDGRLTHEETLMIAKGLNLTAREYMEIFCTGVFTPDKKVGA